MSRLRLPLPALMFSLLLLAALFALQCPEFGCAECSADEVVARQGGALSQPLIGTAVSHVVVAPAFSVAMARSVAVPDAAEEHPALVSRLQI